MLGVQNMHVNQLNPFASEAVYTRNCFFDRLSDSM